MRKEDPRLMKITFNSEKNGGLINVNSKWERMFARKLEEDDEVLSFIACVKLDKNELQHIDFTKIRKSYMNVQWLTSFVIDFINGERGVREIVLSEDLTKLAEIEKLELSRRYWRHNGILNWKVIEVVE